MSGTFWTVHSDPAPQALTPAVRTWLRARFPDEPVPPAGDTFAAIVSVIHQEGPDKTVLVTFPFTFVLANYRVDGVADKAGDLEAAIDAACRARLLALRNAAPLVSIVDRVHPL